MSKFDFDNNLDHVIIYYFIYYNNNNYNTNIKGAHCQHQS